MSSQTPLRLPDASPSAQPRARRPHRSRRSVLLAVILTAQLMVVLDMSIVNVALPSIQDALSFSPSALSWVLNAYTLTFGGLLLLGARAGDVLGRRQTFLTGITVFTLASMLGGLATSSWWLLAARGVQGLGAALAAPAVLALLAAEFAEGRDRTRAVGLYTAVSVGGAAVGLVAGGVLTEWVSWRGVMFVNVPVGLALVGAALSVVRGGPRSRGRFDVAGAATSTVGMTALVFGFVHAAASGWHDATTVTSFAVGVVLMLAFVLIERRASTPVVPLTLFAHRGRSGAYLGRLLMFAAMSGMFFFLTLFLQQVLGYSPLRTGVAFLPVTLALLVASQLSARTLVDRLGPLPVLLGGATLSLLSMLWLTRLSAAAGYADLVGPLLLMGLGNGSAFVPLTNAGLAGVPQTQAGAASGLMNAMQQVGGSLGLAVLVTVFGRASRAAGPAAGSGTGPDAGAGLTAVQHAFVVGADQAFLAAAGLLALALVLFAVLHEGTPATARAARVDDRAGTA